MRLVTTAPCPLSTARGFPPASHKVTDWRAEQAKVWPSGDQARARTGEGCGRRPWISRVSTSHRSVPRSLPTATCFPLGAKAIDQAFDDSPSSTPLDFQAATPQSETE